MSRSDRYRRDPPAMGERATLGLIWTAAAVAAIVVAYRKGQTRQISDVIGGVSILTGFLFAQLLFIFQIRMRITDSQTIPTYGALRRLVNAAFGRAEAAVLSALATTLVAVSANAFARITREGIDYFPGRWWTAVLVFLAVQTVGLVLMTMWDLHRAYRQMPG